MASSSTKLTSIGIEPSEGFPTQAYEIIHSILTKYKDSHFISWQQFAGSWNAVGYRYKTLTEHDEAFTNSIETFGVSVPQPQRYIQERELFGFFTVGLAIIEAFYYGQYAIGSMIKPEKIPLLSETHFEKVSPRFTAKQFQENFPDELITQRLQSILVSEKFKEWNKIRNVLIHRASPGRAYHHGGDIHNKTMWLTGILIDHETTAERKKWITSVLNEVLTPTADFCRKYL